VKSIAAWLLLTLGMQVYWTPTFRGSHTERYIKAIHYYHKKMGLTQSYAFDIRPSHPDFCAWVTPTGVPNMVHFGLSLDCTNQLKPELLALHEACHVRYAHVSPGIMLTADQKHEEVRSCMAMYSSKERR
jgi:hypothetical protein